MGSAALFACLALWQAAPAGAQTRKRPPARPAPARPVGSDVAGNLANHLAGLVQAYREIPTPGRRRAVETYAAAHAKDNTGALARLALGVTAYEQKNYPDAIGELKPIQTKLPQIADYTAYYLAAARVESNDTTVSARDLAPAHPAAAPSPVSGQAWLVEARALKTSDAGAAIRLLRERYADLPQPDGDLTLAACYEAASLLPNAVELYQRVYFQYVVGDAAARSAAALVALKDTMGAAYPQPLPEQTLRRAGRLLELREYADARSAYQALLGELAGAPLDRARVSLGAADFLRGETSLAYSYLRDL
ncbi:MAG TPA: hypothetical protein VKJ01_26540, partial [Candidatus Solibacter sp.]|nr:hypothetical protein [Candidatus Solibacter sp.]